MFNHLGIYLIKLIRTVWYNVFHGLTVLFGHASQGGECEQPHGETRHAVY